MTQVISRGLPFLKNFAKAAPVLSQLYGAYEGTNRLLKGEPAHKVGMGYGYALPGPWGWANFAADTADNMLSSNPITDIDATKKGLEKYGFNENFALEPNSDGNYSVVRSDVGRKMDDWLAKTANSPAAQAGFSDPERWALQQQHQDWKEARKSGTLDQFAEQYPNSQTAKELAIRNRIPTSMDMEF